MYNTIGMNEAVTTCVMPNIGAVDVVMNKALRIDIINKIFMMQLPVTGIFYIPGIIGLFIIIRFYPILVHECCIIVFGVIVWIFPPYPFYSKE